MMQKLRRILEMIRFSHTLFALPFALFGAILAWHEKGRFQLIELVGILLCMVFARSAAMAFNRLADRRIDADNPRTATRHLPAGLLSVAGVWAFTLACSAAFVASTLLFWLAEPAIPWPSYLSIPVLAFVCAYSYTKRFTSLAHFWLGASLLLAPLAAWIAILGMHRLEVPATLGLVVFFWVAGFDVIYACQDADFDRKAKLHSVPAKLGVKGALRVALVCHLLMLGALVGLYFLAHPPLGTIYLIGVGLTAALLVYEHWLVRPDDLARVNQAFFHVNVVISMGLLAILVVEIVLLRM
ncbi:MAG: putative 4-hydroxybenzoate polyprenyltransferase [Gemmataceae bacterium]|nr:putative 4-hydroxybenzoate polyprenyltransferase [Gemmataceae bacterium]